MDLSKTLPLHPSDELVATAWIATIPGLSSTMVGTQLPPDVNPDGTPAAWLQTGFVTVAVVGGTPGAALPVQRPVMQVDCWATNPGSNKPPWGMAAALAQTILRATWDRYSIPRPLPVNLNGVTYPTAVVRTAYVATSFRRLYDDQADYARYQGDLALEWTTVNDTLD